MFHCHEGAMMDIETLIEKRISQIVDFQSRSDTYVKYSCIAAYYVVGSYSGATEVIAKQTNRSVSSVQNWAHAFRLYKTLRSNGNRKLARRLYRTLPASHWWLAYDIQQSGYDAMYYLENADLHHWGGRDMMKEYRQDRESGGAPLVLKHACFAFAGLAKELSIKYLGQLTVEQISAVMAVRKAFEV
jgi:hypothetical protein